MIARLRQRRSACGRQGQESAKAQSQRNAAASSGLRRVESDCDRGREKIGRRAWPQPHWPQHRHRRARNSRRTCAAPALARHRWLHAEFAKSLERMYPGRRENFKVVSFRTSAFRPSMMKSTDVTDAASNIRKSQSKPLETAGQSNPSPYCGARQSTRLGRATGGNDEETDSRLGAGG
jgi:hypothetical protein